MTFLIFLALVYIVGAVVCQDEANRFGWNWPIVLIGRWFK